MTKFSSDNAIASVINTEGLHHCNHVATHIHAHYSLPAGGVRGGGGAGGGAS